MRGDHPLKEFGSLLLPVYPCADPHSDQEYSSVAVYPHARDPPSHLFIEIV